MTDKTSNTDANTPSKAASGKDEVKASPKKAEEATPVIDGFLSELPKDAVVVGAASEKTMLAESGSDLPLGAAFSDEYHGKGGTFALDEKTGNRVPVYNEVVDPVTGKSGYVRAM